LIVPPGPVPGCYAHAPACWNDGPLASQWRAGTA
jgi:hypothetical protein